MMTTRHLIVGLIIATTFLGNIPACAEGAKLLFFPVGAPAGIKVVPPTASSGTTPVYWNPPNGQLVIPRYANGATHPAGQLVGWGPTSVIQATDDTLTRSPPAVVVTEDYANLSKDQWQGSAAGSSPNFNSPTAVLQPIVRDVTIVGRSTGDDYYSNGDVHDHPAFLTTDPRTVSGATNATPIVITTTTSHGYANDQAVLIYGVTGNVAANGLWRIANKTDASGSVSTASNTTPVVITTTAPHGLANGNRVVISGVSGSSTANGEWVIGNKTDTTFELAGSTAGGAGTGGTWKSHTFELVGSTGNGTYVSGGAAASRTTGSKTGLVTVSAGTSPILVHSAGHGLENGDHIFVYNALLNGNANGWHVVASKTTDTFALEGTFGPGLTGSILTASSASPIVVQTSGNHNLSNGNTIYIAGVIGNANANGWHTITVIDLDEFSLNGTTGSGSGTGGTWTSTYSGGVWACYHRTNDLYHGYLSSASGAITEGVHYLVIPGTAASFRRQGTGATKSGNVKPFDNEKLKLDEQFAARCYRGFNIAVIDAQVGRLSGQDMRDYGVKFTSGATQITGALHFWGIYPGPAAHFFGTGNWGGPLYLESSPWGAFIYSNHNDLGPLYVHSCTIAGIYIYGNQNKLGDVSMINPLLLPQPVCIYVAGQYNRLDVGHVQVMAGCRGIQTEGSGAVGLRVRDYTFLGAGSTSNTKLVDLSGSDVYYVDLDFHVQQATVGLDLETDGGTGRLQRHNRIHVRTPIQLAAGLTTMIDMPGGIVEPSNVVLWNNYRVMGGITNVTAANPAVITCNNHGLVDGDQVIVNDVAGTANMTNVNSWQTLMTVDQIDANTFSVPINTTGGTYTTGSGWWGKKQ